MYGKIFEPSLNIIYMVNQNALKNLAPLAFKSPNKEESLKFPLQYLPPPWKPNLSFVLDRMLLKINIMQYKYLWMIC